MPIGIECLNLLILKVFLKLDTLTGNKNSDFFCLKINGLSTIIRPPISPYGAHRKKLNEGVVRKFTAD